MADPRINITGSFHAEGAREMKRDVDDLSDAFFRFAEEMKGSDEAASRIFQRRAQQNQEQAVYAANLGEYRGATYAGIAQRATNVNDFNNADLALGMAHQSGENTNLVKQRYAELHKAELRYAKMRPGEEGYVDRSDESILERAQVLERHTRTGIAGGSKEFAQQNMERAEAYLEQLRMTNKNSDALDDLTEILKEHRKSIDSLKDTEERSSGGSGGDDGTGMGGAAGRLGQYAMQRGLGGAGELGNVVGMLSRFLGPGGLLLSGITSVVGGAYMAARGLDKMDDRASQESLGFVNLARSVQTNRDLGNDFMEGNYHTNARLEALNFTADDARQFTENVDDLPFNPTGNRGSQLADVAVSGLQLARATGSSPDQIAGLYNVGSRVGAMDASNPEAFASVLYSATRDGLVAGVSQSDTFKAMEGHLRKLDAAGVTVTTEQLANYGEMLTEEANMGISRTGKYGDELVDGLANPKSPGMKMMVMSMLGFGSEKGMPTYEDLGMEYGLQGLGDEYEAMSPFYQGEYLMELLEKRDPYVMNLLGDKLGGVKGLGTRGDINMQMSFGKALGLSSTEKMMQAYNSTGSVTGMLNSSGDRVDEYMNEPIVDAQAGNRYNDGTSEIGLTEELNQYQKLEIERIRSYAATVFDATSLMVRFNSGLTSVVEVIAGMKRVADGEDPEVVRKSLEQPIKNLLDEAGNAVSSIPGLTMAGAGELPPHLRGSSGGFGASAYGVFSGGLEGTTPTATNSRTGAFGFSQIMPGNFDGTGRVNSKYGYMVDGSDWDEGFLQTGAGGGWKERLRAVGLSDNDPVDDNVAMSGDIASWYKGLEPNQQSVMSEYLKAITEHQMSSYESAARSQGSSGSDAQKRAAGAWYGGQAWLDPNDPARALDDGNPNFTRRHGNGGNEPSVKEYTDKFMQGLPSSPTAVPQPTGEPTSSLPTQHEVVVRFEGDGFKVHGDHPFGKMLETAMSLAQAQFKTSALADWQGSNRRGT